MSVELIKDAERIDFAGEAAECILCGSFCVSKENE